MTYAALEAVRRARSWELSLPEHRGRGVAPPGVAAEGEHAGWQPAATPGEIQGGFASVGPRNAAGPSPRKEGESALLPTKLGLSSSIQKRTYFYIFATWLCCAAAHVLWLCNAERKEHPNRGTLRVGRWHRVALGGWWYPRLRDTARNTRLWPAKEKV